MRRRGLRGSVGAEVGLRNGVPGAESAGRAALGDLVEAFLHDRQANADLFARAHQLGALLASTAGCRMQPGPAQYTIRCPIFALHEVVAHSVATTETVACSVCGAASFECDHVPGRSYDGQVCHTETTGFGLDGHLALTADPDFTHTWYRDKHLSTARLIADGTIRKAGQSASCHHCEECPGRHGPSAGDLDPVTRWQQLKAQAQADARTET